MPYTTYTEDTYSLEEQIGALRSKLSSKIEEVEFLKAKLENREERLRQLTDGIRCAQRQLNSVCREEVSTNLTCF